MPDEGPALGRHEFNHICRVACIRRRGPNIEGHVSEKFRSGSEIERPPRLSTEGDLRDFANLSAFGSKGGWGLAHVCLEGAGKVSGA